MQRLNSRNGGQRELFLVLSRRPVNNRRPTRKEIDRIVREVLGCSEESEFRRELLMIAVCLVLIAIIHFEIRNTPWDYCYHVVFQLVAFVLIIGWFIIGRRK